jgi:hypothetical protein
MISVAWYASKGISKEGSFVIVLDHLIELEARTATAKLRAARKPKEPSICQSHKMAWKAVRPAAFQLLAIDWRCEAIWLELKDMCDG